MLNVVALYAQSDASKNGSGQDGSYTLIPISRVQGVQILTQPSAADREEKSTVAPADSKRAQERLDARVRQLKEQAENRGRGVTKEAQAIFDALKRV